MIPQNVFIGPLIRRAQADLVVICLATFKPLSLRFSVKEAGKDAWLGQDDAPVEVMVSPTLYFYFGRVKPAKDGFPIGRLLAYAIGVLGADKVVDYAPFDRIVKEDGLAYESHPLPTFFLQRPTQKLNILYGSCRKIHDVSGGKVDALSFGDTLIANTHDDLEKRPAILCLGGDQIYADDVHEAVMSQVIALAGRIEVAGPEKLPSSFRLPGIGKRKDYVQKLAGFTSGDSDNHLVTFADYLALYGLMWNKNNWVSPPKELSHFTDTLFMVRRLLANIPSYMTFDDHDVTDDWNLSLEWQATVKDTKLGKRIVANALMAFWLCQGYGNDPVLYDEKTTEKIKGLIAGRNEDYEAAEAFFWEAGKWEFFTPTCPFVYFLDTRTERGHKDGRRGSDPGAPAFLKSHASWAATDKALRGLCKKQDPKFPVVLVAAVPVFGFKLIDDLQCAVSAVTGPYFLDLESWSANPRGFKLFLENMVDRNVVLLSGDVHYSFTATVKFTMFDNESLRDEIRLNPDLASPGSPVGATPTYKALWSGRFLQLNSSALKNKSGGGKTQAPANLTGSVVMIFVESGGALFGLYENGEFTTLGKTQGQVEVVTKPIAHYKPAGMLLHHVNDAFNAPYLEEHNLGVASFYGSTVTNYFHTPRGKQHERTWDFGNSRPWESKKRP